MKKPHQESLGSKVAGRVREAIIHGDIALGESLSEDLLAEIFSVSRTPVREALRQLEVQGLVELHTKSATKVFAPTPEQISELCEARFVVEHRAAALAFAKSPAEAGAELSAIVDDMEQCITNDDMQRYGEADSRFHDVFYRYCGNRYLVSMYDLNLAQVAALRTNLASMSPGEPQRSFAEHRLIAEMFSEGQAGGLEETLRDHIHRTEENYVAALKGIREDSEESRLNVLKRALRTDLPIR